MGRKCTEGARLGLRFGAWARHEHDRVQRRGAQGAGEKGRSRRPLQRGKPKRRGGAKPAQDPLNGPVTQPTRPIIKQDRTKGQFLHGQSKWRSSMPAESAR